MNIKYLPRIIVVLVFVGALAAEIYPVVFFQHKLQYKNFVIHSVDAIPETANNDIDLALDLLSKSPIYNKKSTYEIYVANSTLPYILIGPDFSSGSFARTNVFNKISIRRCEFKSHLCYSNSKIYNVRSLSALIAHEVTHVNMRQSIGFVKELLLDRWIKEGLADYIAASSSYTKGDALQLYISGAKSESKSFDYYVYRRTVTYAIEKKGLSIGQLMTQRYEIDSLRDEERKDL